MDLWEAKHFLEFIIISFIIYSRSTQLGIWNTDKILKGKILFWGKK